MEQFLASIERKAYRVAEIAVKNPEDALDIVQDAMFKLVQKYSDKPREDWPNLFWRILYNRINDFHRGSSLKNKWFAWFDGNNKQNQDEEGEEVSEPEGVADEQYEPDQQLLNEITSNEIVEAVKTLSPQQQQAFLLRQWHGYDVKQTASIMDCSDGSVKTHYSRAIKQLKNILSNDKPGHQSTDQLTKEVLKS